MEHYDNLVLAGGGIKIISAIGALEVLHDRGILQNITGLAGSSAGAIVAGAFSVGYTISEIKEILINKNFNDFKDYYRMSPLALLYYYGCCPCDVFYNWYGNLLQKKTGNADITFKEIYEKYGKYLIITGCCLNKRETHYYNYISNPDMPIRKAVRISISMPGLFTPVKWGDDILVDGGLLDNYCIYIFDKTNLNSKEMKITEDNPPHKKLARTIGISFLNSEEQPDKQMYHGDHKINSLIDYISAIFNTMFTQIGRSYINKHYWDRTIPINVGNLSVSDFGISKEQKLKLIELGVNSAIQFLDN